MKFSICIICLLLLLVKCQQPPAEPVGTDHDIVLVNIEQGDREFIGKVLRKIDSLNPRVVGIDVTFQGRKKNDTTLIGALAKLKNDILVYNIKQGGVINGSDSVFTNLADQGNLYYEQKFNLITTIVPLQKVNDIVHESLAYKIARKWNPDSFLNIKVDEKIDIEYTRNQEKFFVLKGSDLVNKNVADYDLPNKIFLVGYLGPGNEDKHFTPLRSRKDLKPNEPDTYGLVIIANEIRTILDRRK